MRGASLQELQTLKNYLNGSFLAKISALPTWIESGLVKEKNNALEEANRLCQLLTLQKTIETAEADKNILEKLMGLPNERYQNIEARLIAQCAYNALFSFLGPSELQLIAIQLANEETVRQSAARVLSALSIAYYTENPIIDCEKIYIELSIETVSAAIESAQAVSLFELESAERDAETCDALQLLNAIAEQQKMVGVEIAASVLQASLLNEETAERSAVLHQVSSTMQVIAEHEMEESFKITQSAEVARLQAVFEQQQMAISDYFFRAELAAAEEKLRAILCQGNALNVEALTVLEDLHKKQLMLRGLIVRQRSLGVDENNARKNSVTLEREAIAILLEQHNRCIALIEAIKALHEKTEPVVRNEIAAQEIEARVFPTVTRYTLRAFKAISSVSLSAMPATAMVIITDDAGRQLFGTYQEIYKNLKQKYDDFRKDVKFFKGAEFSENVEKYYKKTTRQTDFISLNEAQKLLIFMQYSDKNPGKRTHAALESLWKQQPVKAAALAVVTA